MTLTLEQEVQVAGRVVMVTDILNVARGGKLGTIVCGGTIDGIGPYEAGGTGVHGDGWRLTWKRVTELIEAGLSAGALAGAAHGYRRYVELVTGQDWGPINAITDPAGYRHLYAGEYARAHELMRRAEQQIWEQALEVLAPTQQLAMFA